MPIISYANVTNERKALALFKRRVVAYLNNNAQDAALVADCTAFLEDLAAQQPNYTELVARMAKLRTKL